MSRACASSIPMAGIAVLGLIAGGSISHGTRLRGTLATTPANIVRCANRSSFGPTMPRADTTPWMVWHAPQS